MNKTLILLLISLFLFGLIFGCNENTNTPEAKLIGTWDYSIADGVNTSMTFDGTTMTTLMDTTMMGQTMKYDSKAPYTVNDSTIKTTGGKLTYYDQEKSALQYLENTPDVESIIQDGENVVIIYKDSYNTEFNFQILGDCVLELTSVGTNISTTLPSLMLTKSGCTLPPGNQASLIGEWEGDLGTMKITNTQIITSSGGAEQASNYKLLNKYFIELDMPSNYVTPKMRIPYKIENNTLILSGTEYTKK